MVPLLLNGKMSLKENNTGGLRGAHHPNGAQKAARRKLSMLELASELINVHISSGGVRGVWQHHKLLTRHQRLLRLERHHKKDKIELSDEHF